MDSAKAKAVIESAKITMGGWGGGVAFAVLRCFILSILLIFTDLSGFFYALSRRDLHACTHSVAQCAVFYVQVHPLKRNRSQVWIFPRLI